MGVREGDGDEGGVEDDFVVDGEGAEGHEIGGEGFEDGLGALGSDEGVDAGAEVVFSGPAGLVARLGAVGVGGSREDESTGVGASSVRL